METLLWFVILFANAGLVVVNVGRFIETARDGAFDFAAFFAAIALAAFFLGCVAAVKIAQVLA